MAPRTQSIYFLHRDAIVLSSSSNNDDDDGGDCDDGDDGDGDGDGDVDGEDRFPNSIYPNSRSTAQAAAY